MPIKVGEQVYLRLSKGSEISYSLLRSITLDVIRSGPYNVLEQWNFQPTS